MIEGLRVFPAYQDARRLRQVLSDCATCQREQTMTTRQALGCAYMPPVADAQPWVPPAWRDDDRRLTVCPGYTTSLPAVFEVAVAFPQWKAGTLTDYLDGTPPTSVALACLAALDDGAEEHKAWATREAMKPKAGA